MRPLRLLAFPCLTLAVVVAACSGSDETSGKKKPSDAGSDVADGNDASDAAEAEPDSPPGFERFCTQGPWKQTLVPGKLDESSGQYGGTLQVDFGAGIQEGIKVVPKHPFAADEIRVVFAKGTGKARIRFMNTFGRSYPASFADPSWLDANPVVDLVPPIEVDVTDPGPDKWIELPIPETLLQPTQHYMLVYEHLAADPRLGVENLAAGDMDRSEVYDPSKPSDAPIGFDGNYMFQLSGNYFCEWKDGDHAFTAAKPPFSDLDTGWVAVTDLDGDGHDDLVFTTSTGTRAWRGDGKAGFSAVASDPFPDAPAANFFLFGDLDNDGDQDAFASQYVQTDADADGANWDTDCDQTDANVHPGAAEVVNGKDDDCDGVADDGTDTSDQDKDGVTIAAGDCDDTQPTVYPGAPELPDSRDNDCNGKSDEIFAPKILQNDGSGKLAQLANPDVEYVGPSSAAALGDGNADGLLDLYAGYWLVHYPDFTSVPSRYYEGKGAGAFADATAKAGISVNPWRPVYGVLFTDWNDDGKADIYVSNYQLSDNLLWKNLGGTFVDVANGVNAAHDDVASVMIGYPGGHSFGSDSGDIDNDGDIDLFVPDIAHPRVMPTSDPSMLLVNQGAPDWAFTNERHERGIIYDEGDVNSGFADWDNDGDLDLLVVATYPAHYLKLYENDGKGSFTDVTYETGTQIHSPGTAVWSDVDEDGDLDLLVTGSAPSPRVSLFINQVGQKNHYVDLNLRGTTANRDAVGARVTLKSGALTQTREVSAISRHQSSHWLHFGLGSSTSVDSISVRWPSGETETISGASADGRFLVIQGSGAATK